MTEIVKFKSGVTKSPVSLICDTTHSTPVLFGLQPLEHLDRQMSPYLGDIASFVYDILSLRQQEMRHQRDQTHSEVVVCFSKPCLGQNLQTNHLMHFLVEDYSRSMKLTQIYI
jgi:hypothetical protein